MRSSDSTSAARSISPSANSTSPLTPLAFAGSWGARSDVPSGVEVCYLLGHPLAVFDIGRQGNCPYIVSELLEGESLRVRWAAV